MRRLALMGAPKGPCVSARGISQPYLRVTGLPIPGTVTVRTNKGDGVIIESNGIHPLGYDELEWIEVSCLVSKRHMTVCEVVSGKVARCLT
jgi:hypothetical protein